jgi:hypothetical protein
MQHQVGQGLKLPHTLWEVRKGVQACSGALHMLLPKRE